MKSIGRKYSEDLICIMMVKAMHKSRVRREIHATSDMTFGMLITHLQYMCVAEAKK